MHGRLLVWEFQSQDLSLSLNRTMWYVIPLRIPDQRFSWKVALSTWFHESVLSLMYVLS